MSEMTMEAAIIAANRLLTEERMDIDREEMTAAIRKLSDAGRYRIKREPNLKRYKAPPFGRGKIFQEFFCPQCGSRIFEIRDDYCPSCGQAVDWSGV